MVPTNIRSTVILSSRRVLEASGLFPAYEERLVLADRERLRDAIAGVWLPIALGAAHYAACDALGLPHEEQCRMGRRTGDRINGTLLGTVARLAQTAGVTPWTLLEQLPRFWSRGFDGGEVTCAKLGPKEARVTIVDQPLMRFAYFRYGLAGTAEVQLTPFCRRAFVRVERFDPHTFVTSYRYQWA